mmetsp:Transcript_1372/g.5900  ORF Transcript_1372/g.5900 Transcript_1372/m.5900 type:complete len:317 (+) Transcript_1372:526-1476(+)
MRHGHQALMHAVRRANPYWSVLQEARSTERSELLLGHAQRGTTRADVACKAERFGSSREVGRVGVDGLRRAALEQGGRVQVVQSSGLVHHPVELGLRVGKHPGRCVEVSWGAGKPNDGVHERLLDGRHVPAHPSVGCHLLSLHGPECGQALFLDVGLARERIQRRLLQLLRGDADAGVLKDLALHVQGRWEHQRLVGRARDGGLGIDVLGILGEVELGGGPEVTLRGTVISLGGLELRLIHAKVMLLSFNVDDCAPFPSLRYTYTAELGVSAGSAALASAVGAVDTLPLLPGAVGNGYRRLASHAGGAGVGGGGPG